MRKESSYQKIFNFLEEREKLKKDFTLKEISEHCGVKENTINKYFTEKISKYIEKSHNKKHFFVNGILKTNIKDFEIIISQANPNKIISEVEVYYKKILEKSFDSFLLAIENYNRPSLKNKLEVFAILIINAWELLLKAKIIKDSNNKTEINKKDNFTISVEECVKKVYKSECPQKENLLLLIKLRDKATHLLIEEIRYSVSQLFQASIINYIEEYKMNFDKIPLENDITGMLSLIIPGDNKIEEIKKIYGNETKQEIDNFLNILKDSRNKYSSDNFMTEINLFHNLLFSLKFYVVL